MKIYNYIWWLWEFPQLLLGLILLLVLDHKFIQRYRVGYVYRVRAFSGIATSRLIFLYKTATKNIQHEYGHCRQSMILGPLYLIVIGLPSALHNLISRETDCNYYHFYTEKWADKLGGVKR